jgi:hypothetical protein
MIIQGTLNFRKIVVKSYKPLDVDKELKMIERQRLEGEARKKKLLLMKHQ